MHSFSWAAGCSARPGEQQVPHKMASYASQSGRADVTDSDGEIRANGYFNMIPPLDAATLNTDASCMLRPSVFNERGDWFSCQAIFLKPGRQRGMEVSICSQHCSAAPSTETHTQLCQCNSTMPRSTPCYPGTWPHT